MGIWTYWFFLRFLTVFTMEVRALGSMSGSIIGRSGEAEIFFFGLGKWEGDLARMALELERFEDILGSGF
jgi:hypothetical protein